MVEFQPVEEELQDTFIPALFQGSMSQIPGRLTNVLLVNQDGIALPDTNQTANTYYTASYVITGHIIAELRRTAESRSGYHALLIREGR